MSNRVKLEHTQEEDLIKRVRHELGVQSIKLNLRGNKGWPDRMFLLPFQPAFIELKRRGEIPTKLQNHRIQELTNLGYDIIWTSDYDLAFDWLKELYTARLSERGHKADDWAGVLRSALRSGIGEDIDKSSRE